MGLGKTVQTLAHLHRLHGEGEAPGRGLIIAPTSVLSNWQREAERLRHAERASPSRQRPCERAAHSGNADVVLTSYPLLQRDEKLLTGIEWNVVVFDEAQTLEEREGRPMSPHGRCGAATPRPDRHADGEPSPASCGRSSTC